MFHLASAYMSEGGAPNNPAFWAFLAIGAIALFGIFLPVSTWMDARRREREAYYKAESLRRLAEAPVDGARAAIDLLREQEHLQQIKRLEGMKIGGIINIAVGIGLAAMLWAMTGTHGPYLVGAIPGLIGVALLVYVYMLAEPH